MKGVKKYFLVIILVFFLISLYTFTTLAQETYLIKFGHHHGVGSITDKAAHKLAELVSEKSDGKVKIEIYPGAQLGQEKEAVEGILYGSLQMSAVTPSFYEYVATGFGIETLPFLTNSMEQLGDMLNNSEIGDELERRLLEQGVRILGWFHMGPRDMLFVDKEIKTLDELKGLKMRTPEIEVNVAMWKAIGARPTPITWGEVYTALQTGVVDGMASGLIGAKDMKFYEVTKYCLLTHHMFTDLAFVINEELLQSFPEDIQKIIIESGEEATEYTNNLAFELQEESQNFLEKEGLIFNNLSEEDKSRFSKLCEPVNEKWATEHNATDLLELIRKFKESY